MPDNGATRSRRYRLHRSGDHSLCRHERVQAVRAVPDLPEGDLDAQAELVALARRLAAAHEADPGNAAVARELRCTLLALPAPEGPADPLEELRALASSVS
jgi:hypothetical protein